MSPGGSANPPPEERLLRLIRGKGAKPPSAPTPPGERGDPGPADMVSTAVGRRSGHHQGGRGVPDAVGARPRALALPWFTLVMGGLGTLVAVEVGCLIWQAAWPLPTVEIHAASIPAAVAADTTLFVTLPTDDFPSVAASVSRALFTAPTVSAPTVRSPSVSVASLVARLTLTGIVDGDPAQAIIEDSETKKTYFVTTGQMVVGGAILEEVRDTGVVLNLAGERIDLTL